MKKMVKEALTISFEEDKEFRDTLMKKLEDAINDESVPTARFLSLYIDNLVASKKGVQEREMDLMIDEAIALFKLVNSKDEFEKYYIQHLLNRFLATLSDRNIDAEEQLLIRLSQICGSEFHQKVADVIKGFSRSIDINTDFRDQVTGKPFDLSVFIVPKLQIDASFNPCYYEKLPLPPNILEACESFNKFYLLQFGGDRKGKIVILCDYGNASVNTRVEKNTITLETSTIQMLVLNLLNSERRLTFQEFNDRLGVSANDLVKEALAFLCQAQVLKRVKANKAEKALSPLDAFVVNPAFKPKKNVVPCYRIRVSDKVIKPEEGREEMERSRGFELQAHIVRVMKARRNCLHNQLYTEVFKNVCYRFHPTPDLFKKQIATLCETDILERDEDNRDLYHYIA